MLSIFLSRLAKSFWCNWRALIWLLNEVKDLLQKSLAYSYLNYLKSVDELRHSVFLVCLCSIWNKCRNLCVHSEYRKGKYGPENLFVYPVRKNLVLKLLIKDFLSQKMKKWYLQWQNEYLPKMRVILDLNL